VVVARPVRRLATTVASPDTLPETARTPGWKAKPDRQLTRPVPSTVAASTVAKLDISLVTVPNLLETRHVTIAVRKATLHVTAPSPESKLFYYPNKKEKKHEIY